MDLNKSQEIITDQAQYIGRLMDVIADQEQLLLSQEAGRKSTYKTTEQQLVKDAERQKLRAHNLGVENDGLRSQLDARDEEIERLNRLGNFFSENGQGKKMADLVRENADLKEQLLLSQEAGRKSTCNTTEQQLDIPTQKGEGK